MPARDFPDWPISLMTDRVGVSKATRREWIGLTVLALPCMVYSMDLTVLNLAVPTLAAEMKPSASQMLWIIDIYGFMVAGFLIPMGTLGDRIGRRKLLLIGAAAFGIASIAAAFSTSPEMLIVTRAILGIAGATLAPSTLALISTMFTDPKERGFAISMWIASFSAGGLVGPIIGGVLIEHFFWGSVFLIAVPVMVLLLIIGPVLLPEDKAAKAGRIDLFSALLSLTAVLGVVYAIKRSAEVGFTAAAVLAGILGVVLLGYFIRRQRRLPDPMLDLSLFRNPAFSASLMINMAGIMFLFGSFILFAQYLQLVAGLSPLEAGIWSLPSAAAFTLASFITPALGARLRPAYLIAAGMCVAAIGFMGLALSTDLVQIVVASVIFSMGFTPVMSMTTGMVVGAAPADRVGAASAMSETAIELGGALGVALLGSLSAALYRSRMIDVSDRFLPADLISSAQATLGGALAAAAQLPADQAALFLAEARAAFMTGFHAAAALSVVAMLFCAILALATLREVRSAGH